VENDTSFKNLDVKVSLRRCHVHADLGQRSMGVSESLAVLAVAVGETRQHVRELKLSIVGLLTLRKALKASLEGRRRWQRHCERPSSPSER
jgi:hypothetical protein